MRPSAAEESARCAWRMCFTLQCMVLAARTGRGKFTCKFIFDLSVGGVRLCTDAASVDLAWATCVCTPTRGMTSVLSALSGGEC